MNYGNIRRKHTNAYCVHKMHELRREGLSTFQFPNNNDIKYINR